MIAFAKARSRALMVKTRGLDVAGREWRETDKAPEDEDSALNSVLARNIDALEGKQAEEADSASLQDRLAEAITAFSGSMAFVYLHLVLVVTWVAINLDFVPGVPAFDPTFVILATVASVEAIFLSTFVLISQNRAAAASKRQAQLDLQTSLLAEHEVTRLLTLTRGIAERLGVEEAEDPNLGELERDVAPERVLDEIARKGD